MKQSITEAAQMRTATRNNELDVIKAQITSQYVNEKYNHCEIANRIKLKREGRKLNKTELAYILNVDRNTIARWENISTDQIPPLDDMLAMCKLFNCELGYLLGEHDGDTRDETETHIKTGLSLDATRTLIEWKDSHDTWPVGSRGRSAVHTKLKTISFIIEHGGTGEGLTQFLDDLYAYLFGNFYSPALEWTEELTIAMDEWLNCFKNKHKREPTDAEYEEQLFSNTSPNYKMIFDRIPIVTNDENSVLHPFTVDGRTLRHLFRENVIEGINSLSEIAMKLKKEEATNNG